MHILLPFAITLCITLTTFASDILLPSIYKVSEYFSINSSIAQCSISIFFIGQLSGALFWGTLSDKYGSNKTLLASLLIVFLGTVTCIIATTIHLFLMGRYLQGFGAIASPVIGWAMIQHYYPKEKAALIMSIIGGVLSIAPMLAPALGGYIDKFYNWRGCLYFILLLNIVVILNLIVLPNYKDGIVTNKGKNILKTYKSILLDKAFTSNILMFGILASGEWCFLTVIPVYFKQKYNIPSIQDVKDISSIEKLVEMPRLLEVLAQQSGKLNQFYSNWWQLNLDTKTAQKYVDLLETLFLVHQLRPWHDNTLSRIVKIPKIHFIDSGLLAYLNRVTIESIEKDKSSFGALLETWVYSELLKMCTLANESWNIYYYRKIKWKWILFLKIMHARLLVLKLKQVKLFLIKISVV